MSIFSKDIGIDLGTSNVLIYQAGRGIVLREPSVIALDRNTGKVLQVGAAARNMLGRTPGNVVAMHPLKDGAISDYELTARMLTEMVRRVVKHAVVKPRMIVSVPSGITEVEERAVIQAAMEAGARRVYLIEEPLAAGLGAQLDIGPAEGHMVVDIGGGTTDIGVLTMNAVAYSASIKVAGMSFDEAIIRYLRRNFQIAIGENTAEEVKLTIGCVKELPDRLSMLVKGRDIRTGLTREVEVTSDHMLEALRRPARQIVEKVSDVMDRVSPELAADVTKNGVVLTGGGSQLRGMDQLIADRLQTDCMLADDTDSCVAYGCGKSIAWINRMPEGTINIARGRHLRD